MKKLKLQMQMSVDGFVSTGPSDEQAWVTWALDEIYPFVQGLSDSTDTILIGRKLAVDYIPYWQDVFTQPDHPMYGFAVRIVAARKIIFTKTLAKSEWENTELAKGDLVEEVRKLKSQPGKDMVVYGGVSLVADLIKEKLIDDLYLYINPVAMGQGESVFSRLQGFQQFKLKSSTALPSGIVLVHYQPKG